jgi:hypothetical protein
MSLVECYYEVTETPPEVIADVVDSAETAYRIVGNQQGVSPDRVHRMGVCVDVINAMGHDLLDVKAKGYRAAMVQARFAGWDHAFMSILPPASERRIIADPVYLQFWEYETRADNINPDELPRLLLGTPEEAARQALSYGFNEREAGVWGPVSPGA